MCISVNEQTKKQKVSLALYAGRFLEGCLDRGKFFISWLFVDIEKK